MFYIPLFFMLSLQNPECIWFSQHISTRKSHISSVWKPRVARVYRDGQRRFCFTEHSICHIIIEPSEYKELLMAEATRIRERCPLPGHACFMGIMPECSGAVTEAGAECGEEAQLLDLNYPNSTTPHCSKRAILDVKSVTPSSKTPFPSTAII